MARVRLLNSNREFTLLVEKYNSIGNFNYDKINWFVQPGKTKLLHQKGSSRVYIVGTKAVLILDFNIDKNGHLIQGKVEQQLSKNGLFSP